MAFPAVSLGLEKRPTTAFLSDAGAPLTSHSLESSLGTKSPCRFSGLS